MTPRARGAHGQRAFVLSDLPACVGWCGHPFVEPARRTRRLSRPPDGQGFPPRGPRRNSGDRQGSQHPVRPQEERGADPDLHAVPRASVHVSRHLLPDREPVGLPEVDARGRAPAGPERADCVRGALGARDHARVPHRGLRESLREDARAVVPEGGSQTRSPSTETACGGGASRCPATAGTRVAPYTECK